MSFIWDLLLDEIYKLHKTNIKFKICDDLKIKRCFNSINFQLQMLKVVPEAKSFTNGERPTRNIFKYTTSFRLFRGNAYRYILQYCHGFSVKSFKSLSHFGSQLSMTYRYNDLYSTIYNKLLTNSPSYDIYMPFCVKKIERVKLFLIYSLYGQFIYSDTVLLPVLGIVLICNIPSLVFSLVFWYVFCLGC